MKRSAYRERDYAFGQAVLTLRTRVGLTQRGLAKSVGVSRRAIAEWEGGVSHPTAGHLQRFIELAHQQRAFAGGAEEEEIHALWQAARQKVLLDEPWLAALLRPAPATDAVGTRDASATGTAAPGHPSPVSQPLLVREQEMALWTIPYARNPHFSGREELLDELDRTLTVTEADQGMPVRRAALTQAQVISGLGGIGKTQIAVEYAYRARERGRYRHTLWINAASEEAILAGFGALGDVLADALPNDTLPDEKDQRKRVAAILRWLEACPHPWLLIFDNADELAIAQPYLPTHGNGSVLLTTRAHAVGHLAASVEVEPMGVIEGAQLLLRRARRFERATADEINEASNIVITLGQLPLALDQAGAYIEETGCGVTDYRTIYEEHRLTLLARRGTLTSSYPESVATTWSLAFERIAQASPAAAELLCLCALLAPDRIPEELLTVGAPHWPAPLRAAVSDRFLFNQMLESLLAFSLVKRLGDEHLLSIHRLVQAVQVERLSETERRQWAQRTLLALNAVFPANPTYDLTSWPQCRRYLEQVQACDALIERYQFVVPEAADLLQRAGNYLYASGLDTLAELLLLHTVHIHERALGPEHPAVATALVNLAWTLSHKAKYAEVELLFQRAIHISEGDNGAEGSLLASALNGLASLYTNLGRYREAEPLYRRAIGIWQEGEGVGKDAAMALGGLAWIVSQQGDYVEAERLYRRELLALTEQWGPEHPRVAYALLGLAHVNAQLGQYEVAERFYQQALRIRERQLGPEHVLVAVVLQELANLYARQGRDAEAEQLYLRGLRLREQRLGSENSLLSDPLRGLANLYARLGREAEAERAFERSLRLRERHFGLTSEPTAEVLHDLATFRHARGRLKEATTLYQRALRIREAELGANDYRTGATRERLCACVSRAGVPTSVPRPPLSEREREVLQLVAAGHTNKAIGRQLFISASTVNYHLTSIFNKLGVDTRAQAVAVAARRDLL